LGGISTIFEGSFTVENMTVTASSPAFASLVSSKYTAIVSSLRMARVVILGKPRSGRGKAT
jgi:Asp-tRNA(Asn)/Glu-tRNA(Gln) amidotransferase A subunit family amidase